MEFTITIPTCRRLQRAKTTLTEPACVDWTHRRRRPCRRRRRRRRRRRHHRLFRHRRRVGRSGSASTLENLQTAGFAQRSRRQLETWPMRNRLRHSRRPSAKTSFIATVKLGIRDSVQIRLAMSLHHRHSVPIPNSSFVITSRLQVRRRHRRCRRRQVRLHLLTQPRHRSHRPRLFNLTRFYMTAIASPTFQSMNVKARPRIWVGQCNTDTAVPL